MKAWFGEWILVIIRLLVVLTLLLWPFALIYLWFWIASTTSFSELTVAFLKHPAGSLVLLVVGIGTGAAIVEKLGIADLY